MSDSIPEKQWAQVIEKTGGPVDYKQIPGRTTCNVFMGIYLMIIQWRSLGQMKYWSTSSTLVFAILICKLISLSFVFPSKFLSPSLVCLYGKHIRCV